MKRQPASRVLLVEEDSAVREVVATLLVHHGLLVLAAANGSEAIALYREHAASIGMVLMDVGMKKVDGPQTLCELQKIDPRVPCCFMTGGAAKYDAETLLALGAARLFLKPFHVREVVKTLKQLAPGLTLDECASIWVRNPTRSEPEA
jgi:CheY-like chemotaxis protein